MANQDLELRLRISADGRVAVEQLDRTRQAVDGVGHAAEETASDLGRAGQAATAAAGEFGRAGRAGMVAPENGG